METKQKRFADFAGLDASTGPAQRARALLAASLDGQLFGQHLFFAVTGDKRTARLIAGLDNKPLLAKRTVLATGAEWGEAVRAMRLDASAYRDNAEDHAAMQVYERFANELAAAAKPAAAQFAPGLFYALMGLHKMTIGMDGVAERITAREQTAFVSHVVPDITTAEALSLVQFLTAFRNAHLICSPVLSPPSPPPDKAAAAARSELFYNDLRGTLCTLLGSSTFVTPAAAAAAAAAAAIESTVISVGSMAPVTTAATITTAAAADAVEIRTAVSTDTAFTVTAVTATAAATTTATQTAVPILAAAAVIVKATPTFASPFDMARYTEPTRYTDDPVGEFRAAVILPSMMAPDCAARLLFGACLLSANARGSATPLQDSPAFVRFAKHLRLSRAQIDRASHFVQRKLSCDAVRRLVNALPKSARDSFEQSAYVADFSARVPVPLRCASDTALLCFSSTQANFRDLFTRATRGTPPQLRRAAVEYHFGWAARPDAPAQLDSAFRGICVGAD
jgi:hypothetical protein